MGETKKWYKWTVEFSVHPLWVADGFDLDNDRALDMLANDLGYAHTELELKARVVKRPDARRIRKEQGGS